MITQSQFDAAARCYESKTDEEPVERCPGCPGLAECGECGRSARVETDETLSENVWEKKT